MSGYPNTTDHEDIPPRIGATEKLAVDSDSQGGQWRRVKQTPASTNQKVGRIFAEMANLWLLETCDSAAAQLTPSRDQTAHRPCQRMASMPGQTGKRGRKQPVGRKLPRLPPHTHTHHLLPGDPATYGSDSRGEKEPETQLKLRQSRRGNEGEPNTKKREGERGGRREKALTGLSMSALGAGLGPGARQPWRQRGLAGVDDHALITMSQVGQAAKTSNKCTELPC